jgi:hypothetical protein
MMAAGVLLLGELALAGEPTPPMLPPSRNPYEVWQYYAVDRSGRFRPVVVPTSDGYRYGYNGAPYPWASNYPNSYSRSISQAANFVEKPDPVYVMPSGAIIVSPATPTVWDTSSWDRMPYAK